MCAIDECEASKVYRGGTRTARKAWKCYECGRQIAISEQYSYATTLADHGWRTFEWCRHCDEAGKWLVVVCAGWPHGALRSELYDHWIDRPAGHQFLGGFCTEAPDEVMAFLRSHAFGANPGGEAMLLGFRASAVDPRYLNRLLTKSEVLHMPVPADAQLLCD